MAKILLVEDDPMISEIYLTKFQQVGFETDIADSGNAALQKAKAGHYDLILLDLVLPELGGMEVLEEIRTKPGYQNDVKVVVFSNLNEKTDRERALELGANGFIPKTEFSPSQMVTEVERFLHQFEEQRRNAARRDGSLPLVPRGKRILYVEDEEIFCDLFGHRIEDDGYEMVYLDGGRAAVQETLQQPFDLIVTDMAIREINGLDVIRIAKESPNSAAPIILFSASVEEQRFVEAKHCGANKCFLKTRLTPSELLREINQLLGVN